ncbi:MAG: ATP-binding protein [Gemmatimonadaceae bacterium]
MRRICVTGPESTGKTTLAQHLAASLGAPWVPEASRLYAERVGRDLTVDDVEPIAREHAAMADAAAATGAATIVLDTDLVSTSIYGRYYYDFTSKWIEAESRRRAADLYLLCDVDVPWIPDGIRDQPVEREAMLELFRAELDARNLNLVLIRGTWNERLERAKIAAQ